jgi:biopolymer transport protein ExbD
MTDSTVQKKTAKAKTGAKSVPARSLRLWNDPAHNQEVRIEIIPLIDVIFCILTFFILGAVGLSRQQAISLDLPKAKTGTPQMREMLVVSLDGTGQVYVEQQLVTPAQLLQAIQNYHQFNPTGLMVLHASRDASYNEVIQVLDTLRQVGGDRVALATLPGESNPVESWGTYPGSSSLPPATNLPGSSGNALPNSLPPTVPNNPNAGLGNSPLNLPNSSPVPNLPAAPTPGTGTPNLPSPPGN